ncbi:uncharacterized protein METZ01_LOCUS431145, partial [marine metagenome]
PQAGCAYPHGVRPIRQRSPRLSGSIRWIRVRSKRYGWQAEDPLQRHRLLLAALRRARAVAGCIGSRCAFGERYAARSGKSGAGTGRGRRHAGEPASGVPQPGDDLRLHRVPPTGGHAGSHAAGEPGAGDRSRQLL